MTDDAVALARNSVGLKIGIFVLECVLDSGDRDLDLIVIRLLGRHALHPKTGRGENLGKEIVVLACVHDEFKGQSDDQRQHRQLDEQTYPERIPCDERCENDGYDQHNEDEARAAARMEALLCADVFNGQIQSLLVAEDRFVFRTVVLERTADITHKRYCPDVQHEDADTDAALNDVFEPAEVSAGKMVSTLCDEHRQVEEQTEAECHAEYTGDDHHDVHDAFAKGLFQPLFELCRFFVLKSVGIGGNTEHLVGENEAFDHVDDTADDRQTKQLVLVADRCVFVIGDADLFVLLTKCDGIVAARLHHNAFQNSLAADLAALACKRIGTGSLFCRFLFVFCHNILL